MVLPRKRLRDALDVDTQLVEIYEDLANETEEIRLKATRALLIKAQPESGLSTEQLKEILRRLIRGLCSGRKGARLGFSIALTEFQSQLFDANTRNALSMCIEDFIQLLKKETEVAESVSGQEKRDHYFGRLFGAETVIKSGILLDTRVIGSAWSQILDLILGLAKLRTWLREECGWVLYQAVQGCQTGTFSTEHVQILIDKVNENRLVDTPEGVAIWVAALEKYPAVRFPKKLWRHENPLHRKEKAKLAKILREAPSHNDNDEDRGESKTSQKGTWSPKLHFAWEVILDRLLKDPSTTSMPSTNLKDILGFSDFWEECVDKSLFADAASNERKYWGFLLFQRMFQHALPFPIEKLFSSNLLRCLMNQLSSPGRYLHLAAEKSVKVLLRRVQTENSMALSSLNGLMSPPNGEINFDRNTKTKTLEKLTNMVPNSSLVDFLQLLRKMTINPGVQDERSANSKRRTIADLLLVIVARSRSAATYGGNPLPPETEQGIEQVLTLLVELAYFNPKHDSNSPGGADDIPISQASHDVFRAKITSCLTVLTSKSTNPSVFAYHIVCVIISRQNLPASWEPLLVMDQILAKVLEKAWETLRKIHAKEQSCHTKLRPFLVAFKLLYCLTILQVYNGDADAVNMLEELKHHRSDLLDDKELKAPGGPQALIEIILSLVARSDLLFRRICPHIFSACAPHMNESALNSMNKVLMTKENIAGQDEIFNHDDGGEDDISPAEQGHANEITGDESLMRDDSSADSDTEEGSHLSSEDEQDDEELAAFDAKLAQALEMQSTRNGEGAGYDDERSEDDMNDEQMEALDEQLEKVFKERKIMTSNKSHRRDAKEVIINFKSRVLELLEIFVREQHSNPLGLTLLIPLLVTIRTTRSKVVSKKACDLIRDYSRLCKGNNVPHVNNTDATFDLLTDIHDQATREGSHAYTSACSQASLLVVKVLVARDREHLHRIVLRYAATQERFLLDPTCKARTSFFSDWLNWCNSARKC